MNFSSFILKAVTACFFLFAFAAEFFKLKPKAELRF